MCSLKFRLTPSGSGCALAVLHPCAPPAKRKCSGHAVPGERTGAASPHRRDNGCASPTQRGTRGALTNAPAQASTWPRHGTDWHFLQTCPQVTGSSHTHSKWHGRPCKLLLKQGCARTKRPQSLIMHTCLKTTPNLVPAALGPGTLLRGTPAPPFHPFLPR